MTPEILINEIKTQTQEVRKKLYEIDDLIKKLESSKNEDWDWVSVRSAAESIGVCQATLYARINSGKLDCKYIGSKKLIKLSQVKEINDVEVS